MASKKITSIHDLLEQYNERIVNQRDKGTSFERLMKSYLELDPLYQDQFKTVYLWSEWPHKTTGQDYGIDLVARSHLTSPKNRIKPLPITCTNSTVSSAWRC